MNMSQICRRTALAGLLSLALAACNQGGSDAESPAHDGGTTSAALQDMVLGDPDAAVTITEYASWTCPACLQFHNEVVPMMLTDYVETGKVKYVFREFPTAPPNITIAGFAIARCAGPDKYFDVLDELFDRQQGIIAVAREGGQVRVALQQVAANHGIQGDDAFDACLQDQSIRRAIAASVALGDSQQVSATPTVFLNGERLEGSAWRYEAGMRDVLNEALGEDTPSEVEELIEEGEETLEELQNEETPTE